jgi:hypothetical protein
MRTKLMLLVLAAVLLQACADTNGTSRSRRDSIIDQARTCATCGGAVSNDYFAGSSFKAIGPGNY